MKSLAADWKDLQNRIHDVRSVTVGLDFDGTLTPIVNHPDDVALAPSTRDILKRLAAARGVTVAVVSGRTLYDLDRHIGIPGLILIGNHGLERRTAAGPVQVFAGGTAPETVHRVSRELALAASGIPGTWMEDKGMTASLHYRNAPPDALERLHDIVNDFSRRLPPEVLLSSGKCVYDIRLRAADGNKGKALLDVFAEAGVPPDAMVWCFGDDTTDEDAFASMPGHAVTVHVGPLDDSSAARYGVSDPAEVVFVLDAIRKLVELRERTA